MTMAFKLDYVIEKAIQPQLTDVQRTLNALAGVNLSAKEAREVLPRVRDHKWYVSERLGRDVGLRVAAIDYFENIDKSRSVRSKPGALMRKLHRLGKYLGGIYLTHQSWKAHDGLFVHSAGDLTGPEQRGQVSK